MLNGEYFIQELCRKYTYIIRIVKCKGKFDYFEAKMKCQCLKKNHNFCGDKKIPYGKQYKKTCEHEIINI